MTKNCRLLIALFASTQFVISCATSVQDKPPCYDGWTIEGEAVSKIITPPREFWQNVNKYFGVSQNESKCVHFISEKKKYIIIYEAPNGGFETLILQDSDGALVLVERGLIF